MSGSRSSLITNEPVGAKLGRLFRRNRTPEEQDILDAYRRQIPVDEIHRERAAAAAAPAPTSGPTSRPAPRMGDPEGSAEAATALRGTDRNRPVGQPAPTSQRPSGRTPAQRPAEAAPVRARARPSQPELTADQLNTMVLERLGKEPLAMVPDVPQASGPGAALARERINARMAEPYKKGGLVKPKKGATSKMPANKPPAGIASAKTPFKFAKGGASKMKHEDEAMDKKLIRSEMAKAGVGARGGKAAKYARGGGVEIKGKTRGKLV